MQLLCKINRTVAPPPSLTVSEWADAYRRLSPESSAEPGRWTTARAEYQRGIMDALSDPRITTITIMSSAQVGKTEILNNIVGYYIHQDPAPIMVIQPTLEMAQAWSKDRLDPMIRDTAELKDRVADAKSRTKANTLLHKIFPNGHITMAGANSSASLASRPIRVVLCDQVDRYPPSAGVKGDPVSLVRKRSQTFWNRKHMSTSTPTLKGVSRIEMEFEISDQRFYYVPCPHCHQFQRLLWRNVSWPEHQPEKAEYRCEHCAALFGESQRLAAIKQGEWRASQAFNGHAGFHLSELYSPWSSLSGMATAFVEAKKSTETLKTFVNTALGESWEDKGETIDNESLFSRREHYAAPVPQGALVLTAGVDVQQDRLEVEVIGWGKGEESWSIEYLTIPGDPARQEVWRDLDDLLEQNWLHETDVPLHIAALCIDSGGHHTSIVYDYCARRSQRRVFAVKGQAGSGRPVVQLSVKRPGNKSRRNNLYLIGVDDAKGILYARLRISEPGPGYCHFPLALSKEYFYQLTAEKQVTRFKKGFPSREWLKIRARNEALDCRIYGYAALKLLNPVWSALSKRLQPAESNHSIPTKRVETPSPKPQPAARPQRRKSARSGFVNSWR